MSDGNKEVLRIPQRSSINADQPSYGLVSYPDHWLDKSYPSAKMHLLHSPAAAD